MGRIHLFEFEDQNWFPDFLRNYGTDFLRFMSNKTKMYKPIIPILEKTLQKSKQNQIIDLGSGGGGGWLWLNSELIKSFPELKVVLTDYYPNLIAFKFIKEQTTNITFIDTSVDARNVPKELKGLRTQFLSLHHFKPIDAQRILQNAIDAKSSICIFEAQERSVLSILAMVFSPLSIFLTTPFIRPFKFGRIFFTYLVPVVPLFVLWDGIISCLRTYSVKEMKSLIEKLDNKNEFNWEVNRLKSGPGVILYLVGNKN